VNGVNIFPAAASAQRVAGPGPGVGGACDAGISTIGGRTERTMTTTRTRVTSGTPTTTASTTSTTPATTPATTTATTTPTRPPAVRPLLREVHGRLIRGLRTRQGRTLAEVAARAGVSLAYLSEVERGLKEPSSEVLEAVCVALGSSVTDLVGAAHRELLDLEQRSAAEPHVLDLTQRREQDTHRAFPATQGTPASVSLRAA
jgi:transcriptional regulator with XRE-family HTH domain